MGDGPIIPGEVWEANHIMTEAQGHTGGRGRAGVGPQGQAFSGRGVREGVGQGAACQRRKLDLSRHLKISSRCNIKTLHYNIATFAFN